MERDFEEKAEELRERSEEEGGGVYPGEEEGVVIAPGYRVRKSPYRRTEEEEDVLVQTLRSIREQFRDVKEDLVEFGEGVKEVNRQLSEASRVVEAFKEQLVRGSREIGESFVGFREGITREFRRIGRILRDVHGQFSAIQDIQQIFQRVSGEEERFVRDLRRKRQRVLEETNLGDVAENIRKGMTISQRELDRRVREAGNVIERYVRRPLRELRIEKEIRGLILSSIGPLGSVIDELIDEAGGLRDAFDHLRGRFLTGIDLIRRFFSIFGRRKEERGREREETGERLDWRWIRERRRGEEGRIDRLEERVREEWRRRREGVGREREWEVGRIGEKVGQYLRNLFPESFVGLGFVGMERRREREVEKSPEEMYLIQERGAVFEAEKLYVKAGTIDYGEGMVGRFLGGGGRGVMSRVLEFLGIGAIARVIGRILPVLGRYFPFLMVGAGLLMMIAGKKYLPMRIGRGVGLIGGGVTGSVIGSMIAPGIGTIIGGIIGGIGGEKLGEIIGKMVEEGEFEKIVRKVKEQLKVGDVFKQVFERLKSIGEKIRENLGLVKEELEKAELSRIGKGLGEVGREMTDQLGIVARKLETGVEDILSASGVVSRSVGDLGRVSYGMYQIAKGVGTLSEFISWMGRRERYRRFAEELGKLKQGSKEFDAKWKELSENYREFLEAQHEFILETHYRPVVEQLRELGLEVERSRALQEAIFARAVQQRGQVVQAFRKAFEGYTPEEISEVEPEEVIRRFYTYLIQNVGVYFRSSSWRVRRAVRKRLEREMSELIAMARLEREMPEDVIRREAARVEETRVFHRQIRGEEVRGVRERKEEEVVQRPRPQASIGGYMTGEVFERVPSIIDDIGVLLLQLGLL